MPAVIVLQDPLLGCIPGDVTALLKQAGVDCMQLAAQALELEGHALATARVLVAGASTEIGADLMDRMPALQAIVSAIVGTDAIDLEAAGRRSIAVANSPVVQASESLAEASILLILACLYDLQGNERILRSAAPRPLRPSGRMLAGRTLGLIGFGASARAVARRLAGWNVRLLAYARRPMEEFPAVEFVGLERLLGESDVVSIHAGLNAQSRNLLDATRLGAMKPGAILVNTARGHIVDEAALARACESGHIRSIAVDVFANEQMPLHSPLLALPHAILTPHRLGHTQESFAALAATAAANVQDALAGRPLRNSVCG